jgi:TetR/AcrR family transcriptional repressor of nem operon
LEVLMRYTKADKAATHDKIVRVAARRFREHGLEGIGIEGIMTESGTTVGNFYKHFASRDELAVEALAEAFKDLDRWDEKKSTVAESAKRYLTDEHRDHPGSGCALGALLGDMRHASNSVRAVYTERTKRSLVLNTRLLPGETAAVRRQKALFIHSALLGAIGLSRAVSDSKLSREILASVAGMAAELATTDTKPLKRLVKAKTKTRFGPS